MTDLVAVVNVVKGMGLVFEVNVVKMKDLVMDVNGGERDGSGGLKADLRASTPTPLDVAELADQMQALLAGLGEQECQILDLKLQQHTNDKIAEQLGCSERTVRRVLKRMQDSWLQMEQEEL